MLCCGRGGAVVRLHSQFTARGSVLVYFLQCEWVCPVICIDSPMYRYRTSESPVAIFGRAGTLVRYSAVWMETLFIIVAAEIM